MYDHTQYCGKKHCFCHCLQVFSIAKILKNHVNDCFKINGKEMIKISQKGEFVRLKKK